MATPPGNPHQNEATPSGSHHPPATRDSDARSEMEHIPRVWSDWSAEEQAILEDGMVRYASEKSGLRCYLQIASRLQNKKSVREVALRCRWVSNKESIKRREVESTRNRDRTESVTNKSSGTPSRLTSQPDTADGISYNGEWLSGSAGIGFSPHVIRVAAGEDIASKILSFSQHGPPRATCVLSANGSVSKATLRQPSAPGGAITYEGRFEIVCLSGSFLPTMEGGSPNRTGGLSVSLGSLDGRVIGGLVGEMLIAASPTQVCLGSFMWECTRGKNNKGAGLEHSNHQASKNSDTREHLSPPSGSQHLSPPSDSQRNEHDNVLEPTHQLAVEKRRAATEKTRLASLLEKIGGAQSESVEENQSHGRKRREFEDFDLNKTMSF